MKTPVRFLIALLPLAAAAQTPPARQDHAVLRQAVEQFLRIQSAGLPGQVTISVGQVDPRLNLAACAAPEAFLPGTARVWGKTTVGVRCSAPAPWTVYIPATVSVTGDYLVTATPLAQGQVVGPNDLAKVRGDLTALPQGIVTDASQAVGRTLNVSLRPGTPLRGDSLRSQQVVQQGQLVRLVTNGPGFSISAEARAISNAADGQIAQARTQAGQVVSGVARAGGVVEVTY
ncbi:flagellar basal body P-ring formation protein FlgA [Oxalobacteraceae bacterium OM1]|nr:flagellar basal body P-ring formation protein FlgA [Oxalobacteraceae bacterium OM1]